jgi:hypothetical protein
MGLYSAMFWGFNQILPQQKSGDSPDRPAFFFALAWVGYVVLADVVLLGQALPGMLGKSYAIAVVGFGISLYACHVACFWRSAIYHDAEAGSRRTSSISTLVGVVFVVVGWCAGFGGAALLRS